MDIVELTLAALYGAGAVILLRKPLREKSQTQAYPVSRVVFERALPDSDRLRLLDEARAAVIDGRLSQANQLEDDRAANQASKPGAEFEN
jgi:hypothetical protein